MLVVSIALAPPLMLLFLHTDGWAQWIVLSFLGLTMLSSAPVIMAVVLENAGDNPAAANGTYFMISFAARSVILLAVGWLGDIVGLRTTYMWCGGFAALGLPFVLLLPKSGPRR